MNSFTLYAILDADGLDAAAAAAAAGQMAAGGADIIQYRRKKGDPDALAEQAFSIREKLGRGGPLLFVNDDPGLAAMCGADGVHLGQEDMPVHAARRILGPGKRVGVSVRSVEEAIAAEEAGADYLAVGDLFGSKTKKGAKRTSLETLREICQKSRLPVVGIGGVTLENMEAVFENGASAVAVSGAIMKSGGIEAATREFKDKALKLKARQRS